MYYLDGGQIKLTHYCMAGKPADYARVIRARNKDG